MRMKLWRLLTIVSIFLLISGTLSAQSCISTGINGSQFDLLCNQTCTSLHFQIPHLKSTSDYSIVSIPYAPYPYLSATGQESPNIYADDQFGDKVAIPFPFCFYDSVFTKLTVGSNGLLTFDTTNANCSNAYTISPTIPYAGGSQCSQFSTYYPRAAIMGAYSDLDPRTPPASPSDRLIQWHVEGTAPCRKFIISFYHIGVYGTTCGVNSPNTFQMVLHESTGIIEIFVEQKACTSTTNNGRAIMGIQNWNRDKAVAAPGKNSTVWNENNTGYRFVPSGSGSRFVSCQLYTMAGSLVANADTTTTTAGVLDVNFNGICPPVANTSTNYVVKTTFAACEDPLNLLISYDTILINRTNSLNATGTATNADCGVASGTITITVPAGAGTAPYTFQLDGGTPQTGNSPFTFSNLATGNHTIIVTDASGGCTSTVRVRVNQNTTLNASATFTATTCPGVNNGTITATVAAGTAPFTFQLDAGPQIVGTNPYTFTNVSAGVHTVVVSDAAGCQSTNISVTVTAGAAITATATSTAATCPGATDGTITITPTSGTGPYTFQLDGGSFVSGSSPYTFTNVSFGSHTVVVKDANGCTSNAVSVNVTAGAGISATITTLPASCQGVNNGSITVTPTNGASPYTYQLDGGAFIPGTAPYTFTNVSSGNHTIAVRDANGCISSAIAVTVGSGAGLNATTSTSPTSCAGVNNGSITVTPTSGTGPYSFQLDGGPFVSGTSPYLFANVSSGNHTVVVKDANGCLSNAIAVNVGVGAGVSATTNTTSTSCAGVNNGSITVTATTGNAPYTFQLDGGAFVPGTSPYTFSNVSSGNHTIVVKDVNGCLSNAIAVNVGVGTGVSATTSTTSASCASANNGSITVMPTSGTAPYTFSLDGGAFVSGSTPYTFTNISSGNHTIAVTDINGCVSSSIPVTVATGPGVIATTNAVPTSCAGANNGSITVTPTTGTAPYTYQLNAGPFQPSNVFSGLAAATYSVTVKDANGCINTYNVTVSAGATITANITSTASSCLGATNGSITITPTNGSAPYSFSIDGGAAQAGASPFTFTNVAPGNHSIVITEGAGCISSPMPISVAAGPALTTTVNKTDVLCNGGSTGTITVTVPVIGSAPYQYSLDGVTWQASNNFNGLASGTYTVYYRESHGCQGSQSVTINQPAVLSINPSATAVVCNGQNNGIINISGSGGASPYQYSLNGGSYQANNIFNVAAGTYTVSIRDNNNCTATQSVTVTQPPVLTANTSTTNASCNGGNDGSITVTAGGGNSGYQYSLDGINFQPSNILNVAAGNYTVTIKDNLGCTITRNVTVGQTNNMTLTPQADKTICEGKSTQLQLVSNATQYSWTPATGLNNSNISNPVANPNVTTQYIVIATLGNCNARDTVIVNVLGAPIPNAGQDGVICYGQTYQLQGSGGVTYSWSPSTYLSSASVSNPIVTPSATTTYSLSVTDASGCQSLIPAQVRVNVTPPIVVLTSPKDTIVYTGDQFQVIANSIGNIYDWSPSIGISNPNISNPVITGGAVGDIVIYKVTASTAAGCKGDGYVKVQVYKGPDIYVPTAFTPNNDGKNDKFTPVPVGIKQLNYFMVYNRWGQLMFSTTTMNDGWDGKYAGKEQSSGVFVWMIQGVTRDDKLITKKGTVALIR